MKANAVVIFMLLIVVPSIVKTEMCTCPSGSIYGEPDLESTACLRAALQAELTSTPTYIHQLQNLFYFSNSVQSFLINTSMTVNVSCESTEVGQLCNSSIHQFSWTHHWYENTAVGVIRELIAGKFLTDPVALFTRAIGFAPISPFLGSQERFVSLETFYLNCSCVSRGEQLFQCEQLSERRIREIWEGILQWSKAYARKGGPVPAPSDSDKGQVSCTSCPMQPDLQPGAIFSATCLALLNILNLVVGVLLMAFIPSQMIKQNISLATSSLFWSTAIIGAPFAFYFLYGKLFFTFFYDRDMDVYAAITWSILLFLLTLELMVSILRSKHSGLAIPRCVGYCCSVCCFCFFCCCCRPGGRSHSRVAHALSLWFVMASLQLITSSVVPVIITVLSYSPVLSLAALALMVSTISGMVVVLGVLLYTCSQQNRSKRCLFCTYSLILAGVLAMVWLVIYLFLVIISNGGPVNSITGFITTLVPSAILSMVTWFVKMKVFGKKPTEANHSNEHAEGDQEYNTLL